MASAKRVDQCSPKAGRSSARRRSCCGDPEVTHPLRPFGGQRILFVWVTIERQIPVFAVWNPLSLPMAHVKGHRCGVQPGKHRCDAKTSRHLRQVLESPNGHLDIKGPAFDQIDHALALDLRDEPSFQRRLDELREFRQ